MVGPEKVEATEWVSGMLIILVSRELTVTGILTKHKNVHDTTACVEQEIVVQFASRSGGQKWSPGSWDLEVCDFSFAGFKVLSVCQQQFVSSVSIFDVLLAKLRLSCAG